jgi:hypothetical protein
MNNIRYSIMESPHRWLILAGITALVTLLGTMTILVYAWSHVFGRIFFYAGLAVTIAFLLLTLLDWKERVEEEMAREERSRAPGSE